MYFKFILMQSLISLSYKVNYFDFAVFQILLMRSLFPLCPACGIAYISLFLT